MSTEPKSLWRPRTREEVIEKLFATIKDTSSASANTDLPYFGGCEEEKGEYTLDDYYTMAAQDILSSGDSPSAPGMLYFWLEVRCWWTDHLVEQEELWYEQQRAKQEKPQIGAHSGQPRTEEEVRKRLFEIKKDFPVERYRLLRERFENSADESHSELSLDDYYILAAEDIEFSYMTSPFMGGSSFCLESESFWIAFLLGQEQWSCAPQPEQSSVVVAERVNYYEYIRSDRWRQKANQAKQHAGYRCQVCNRPSSEVQLDAHHRTYERLGNELPEDITVLCRDCHSLYELNGRPVKPPGAAVPAARNSEPTYAPRPTVASLQPSYSTHPEVDHSDTVDPSRHLLPVLGSAIFVTAMLGNLVWLLAIEWSLIVDNLLQFLNPLLQIQVFFLWITAPLTWQLVLILLSGATLSAAGVRLVAALVPRQGCLRWYWTWTPYSLAKVPFFLAVTLNGMLLFQPLTEAIIYTAGTQAPITRFPLLLPVLNVYCAFLPIPLVHLIWDNRYHNNWAKIATTLLVLCLVAAASALIIFLFVTIASG